MHHVQQLFEAGLVEAFFESEVFDKPVRVFDAPLRDRVADVIHVPAPRGRRRRSVSVGILARRATTVNVVRINAVVKVAASDRTQSPALAIDDAHGFVLRAPLVVVSHRLALYD